MRADYKELTFQYVFTRNRKLDFRDGVPIMVRNQLRGRGVAGEYGGGHMG
jgi:hypothetical protein